MYARFFGLKRDPFSIAPDPRFLFMSERHREALAHLLYGVDSGGGFVLLTGEIGAGKTTVCRCFLEQIPQRCNVAYIFNPKLTVEELMQSICDEFRIACPHVGPGATTVKDYVDPLNEFLLRTHAVGQNNVLIIDEAQNLSAEVLEQLRLLTNLETNERKLLQIILIGQPELRDLLARPELEQLAQRVIARFHLDALSEKESSQYIRHRLAVAGHRGPRPFERDAVRRIHQLARGVPRRINLLCDRALLGAYATGKSRVDRAMVDKAALEVFGRAAPREHWKPTPRHAVMAGLGLLAGASLWVVLTVLLNGQTDRTPETVATASSGVPAATASDVGRTASTPGRTGISPAASASSTVVAPGSAATETSVVSQPTAAGNPSPEGRATAIATNAASAAGTPADAASAAFPANGSPPAETSNAEVRPAALAAALATEADAGLDNLHRNERDAWRELAAVWGLALPEGDPCQPGRRGDVLCFRGSGDGIALIRRLGRPGILSLRDVDGRPGHALITGLTRQTATLRVQGVMQTVSLETLARTWQGNFATFWKPPAGYRGRIAEGSSGPVVDWVAASLAQARGLPAPSTPQVFDTAMKTQLFAFQFAQEARPDGLAGPETLMLLNRVSGVDEPRLQTEE